MIGLGSQREKAATSLAGVWIVPIPAGPKIDTPSDFDKGRDREVLDGPRSRSF